MNAIVPPTGFARYAPWLMAFLALFMLFVTNGFTTTSLTAYDESLLKEFGWSRGQLKFRDLITLMIAGLSAPFAGILIDKIGTRKLMLTGSLLLAAAYFSYGFITSLTHLYLIHAVFGIVLVCAGLNVAVIHVSQWFHTQRGTGIGIALVGSSLGGALLTPILVKVVATLGWRATFMWMSALAIVLFFVCLFGSRSPAHWGVSPLKAAPNASGAAPKNAGATPHDLTLSQAMSTVSFWALAVIAMATFYSLLALAAHLFLHLRGLGLTPQKAGAGISALFSMGLISKFLFGYLADKFNLRAVFLANIVVMLAGLILFATQSLDLVWPAIIITGFGWGGLYTLLQLQAVNNFGLTHSGKILGSITLMDACAGGLGMWLTGVLFDRYKSYDVAFYVLVGLVTVAFLAAFFVKREVKD